MAQLWVASYGYRDCDTMGGFAGFRLSDVESAMAEAVTEEAERSRDQCDGECDPDGEDCNWCSPGIATYGFGLESSKSLELSAEQREELCRTGLACF